MGGVLPNCTFLRRTSHVAAEDLEFVEMFAGKGEVWRAVSRARFSAARVDIDYDKERRRTQKPSPMDFLSDPGFATLVLCALVVAPFV